MVAEDLSDFLKTILLFIVFVAFFKEKTKNIVLQKVAESRSKNLKSKKSTAKKKSVASSRVVNKSPKKPKKPKPPEAPRKWRPQWAEVPGFRNWIFLDLNDLYHVRCKICNDRPLTATTTTLEKHACSNKHARNCKAQGVEVIKNFKMPNRVEWDRKVAIAELKFAGVHANFNYSYKNSDLLKQMLRNIDPTSVFSYLKVGATKITCLVVNLIAKAAKEELANTLKGSNFSICLDESTDSSKDKILVINVRYFDSRSNKILTKMWAMPKIFIIGKEANAGAKRICEIVLESFTKEDINILNIVGCCSDGCNTMIGENSGLKALMLAQIPHLKWVQCPAHKTHLCARHAMDILPNYIIQLLINFHSMLKTAHRKQDFHTLQLHLGLPNHKIPRFIPVRWLSLESCVNRALEQWQALFEFSKFLAKRNDALGKKVYAAMRKPETKLYFLLLQCVLKELNLLNKFFQQEGVVIDKCADQIEKTYKKILCSIKKCLTVTPLTIQEVQPFNEKEYLNYEDFQLGEEIGHYINKHGDKIQAFLERAYKFVSVVCIEMDDRFENFEDELFTAYRCMNPQNALSEEFHAKNGHLFEKWLSNFSFLIAPEKLNEVRVQWNLLPTTQIVAPEMAADQFWYVLYNLTDSEGNFIFTELANTAIISLTVPHGNAESERKFSDMNILKTKMKSCMKTETMEATLRAKQYIRSFAVELGGFEPTERMIQLCLERKYYNRKVNRKDSLIVDMD